MRRRSIRASTCIKVTPDPGVIEVNIHPATNPGARRSTSRQALYEDARQSRLGTDKFMIDGRHTGTGGGNHVVLGGAQRRRLARSCAGPICSRASCSIGSAIRRCPICSPACSSARPARRRASTRRAHDLLYELEIALAQSAGAGRRRRAAAWLVDRLFRNLLVDVTGNTHRTEICIDKLFSPDGPTGRLGLVEFRSFEMPPDARMSLAQQLLLRALVAWFWREPLDGTLVRWGTALHDRFMLPHFVWEDFLDVLDDLKRAGYAVRSGLVRGAAGIPLPALRHACSTAASSSNCARRSSPGMCWARKAPPAARCAIVDSSVERLQVKVAGLHRGPPRRHLQRPPRAADPDRPHRRSRRRRALQGLAAADLACTRPSPSHAPLTFDIVDTWSRRSLGGCVYHVAHPGGRNYETFPVNSYEAEARRRARFQDHRPYAAA